MKSTEPYVRAEIRVETLQDVKDFFNTLISFDEPFALEDELGYQHISAESILGVLYACTEWKRLFLVNMANNGYFPASLDKFRPLT